MDSSYGTESRVTRTTDSVESGTVWRAFSRWKPTETQRRILESVFASGVRWTSREPINRITAELRLHGPVEARNVFYWLQNAAARNKYKKGKAESSSQRPLVVEVPSDESSVQEVEVGSGARRNSSEEDVGSGARRISSVGPSEIRTLDLFPLHPGM